MSISRSVRSLRFTVVAADGLPKRNILSLPDPCAVVSVDSEQSYTTSIIKKTTNPYWNETLDINVEQSSTITVQIYDRRRFKKDDQGFLGLVNVRVSDAIDLELGGHQMLTLDLIKHSDNNLATHGKLIVYLSTNLSQPISNSGPSKKTGLNASTFSNNLYNDPFLSFINAGGSRGSSPSPPERDVQVISNIAEYPVRKAQSLFGSLHVADPDFDDLELLQHWQNYQQRGLPEPNHGQVTIQLGQNRGSINPSQSVGPQRTYEDQFGPLPTGWECKIDRFGGAYYVEHETGTTTRHRPGETGQRDQPTADERLAYNNHYTGATTLADARLHTASSNQQSASLQSHSTEQAVSNITTTPTTRILSSIIPISENTTEQIIYPGPSQTPGVTPIDGADMGGLRKPTVAPLYTERLEEIPEAIAFRKSGGSKFHHDHGDDTQTSIDAIDKALDTPGISQQTRKEYLKVLYKMCGHNARLPTSMQILVSYDRTANASYRGGFADVWKGKYYGRDVAVKVIRTYSNSDLQRILGKFCKEVVMWKTLQHPNVLPLTGVMMSKGHFAMISDWMVNGNINDFTKAHPNVNRIRLLEGVAKGLIYIHNQGMIHGDLKGANILVDQIGNARLADFGLLTIISDPTNLLSSSSYAHGGTARWMSPELIDPQQFGFKKSRPTKSSDCYALGMVIYETISGFLPFYEHTDLNVFVKVLKGERPRRESGFTKTLWEMMKLCWAQPGARPSVRSVLQCLEAVSNPSEVPRSPYPLEDEEMGDSVYDWDSTSDPSDFRIFRQQNNDDNVIGREAGAQAARQAAIHRPGKSGGANGKGKRRVGQGGWRESSDEDEEEEECDQEVDSDDEPVAPRQTGGHGHGPGQNLGEFSSEGSPYGREPGTQAAGQAAIHRPGKSGGANGKGKRRVGQGGWWESSDEEEEEEYDEEVESDGEPIAPRQTRGPGPGPGPGQNLGRFSARGSPYGPTSNLGHHGQGKPQRNLPMLPLPDRRYEEHSPSSPQPQGVPIPPRESALSEMAMGY